jgi:hypothetical protein
VSCDPVGKLPFANLAEFETRLKIEPKGPP